MILRDMADYLTSAGGFVQATDLFAGTMPASPPDATALYEAGGTAPEHTMGNTAGQAKAERPRIQVVCRSDSYETARATAQKAWLLLDKLPERTINGTSYYYGRAVQSPFLMGRDEQNRVLVAFNVDILKGMSTTS